MQKIYVSSSYLKTLHYLFFSFAVFSLTAGMIFFNFAVIESLTLLGLSAFYCVTSFFVAYYFYKDYREVIEPYRVIHLYLLPYLLLALWSIGTTVALVLVFPSLSALIYSFLFINYYMFFLVLIGIVLSRFSMVSRVFEMYNKYMLNKAKKLAKRYALFLEINDYDPGSDPRIDALLDDVWTHRSYPTPHVRKLEIGLCERHMADISRMIDKIRDNKEMKDKVVVEALQKMKDDYITKIREIEQKAD
ncbi:MAG: hypothetical protein V1648_01765 [Candidatus Aenigmatarchaeota archaeon]